MKGRRGKEEKESIHHVSSSTKEEGSLCVLSSKNCTVKTWLIDTGVN